MESFHALNIFVRAAESRSFTQAGQRLNLSASAVGKAVSRLEMRLGVQLFCRNTRSVTLTMEGLRFHETCRRIFSEVEAAENEFLQARRHPQGRFRLCLPSAGQFLLPAIHQFAHAHPNVELDMDFDDCPVSIMESGYDLVIRSGEIKETSLASKKLFVYRTRLVGSASYFEKYGVPRSIYDLARHICVHFKSMNSSKLVSWPISVNSDLEKPVIPVTATVNSINAALQLIESDLGIGCIPDIVIAGQIARGTLISVLENVIDETGSLNAAWPSRPFLCPKVRAFLSNLEDFFFRSQNLTGLSADTFSLTASRATTKTFIAPAWSLRDGCRIEATT